MTIVSEVVKRDARAKILRAGVVRSGSFERKVIIRDVSESGAMIQSDVEFEKDEEVWLEFSGMTPIRSIVRWASDNRYGIQFERRIELDKHGKPVAASLNTETREKSFVSWKR
ncbi:PilZ domain-containing protein [Pacificimonas sp. WHA3]|uniref:PilZ domain-containing protein n=1 Tax=Pacificimonas pallii TaxID=2827236 RepID=A0ABS6SE78_9SPHN|nr:PilZ domain-containing protein [Pacificimonas pallii]MBV7256715.1 PilZ domain-containing protein [Pacificimonas pallii]